MRGSRTETFVGIAVLAALAGIGTTLGLVQADFDPALYAPPLPAAPAAPAAAGCTPPGLAADGPVATFGPDTLSDRIDGKADFYLSAGFATLACSRYGRPGAPAPSVEACDYDMGAFRNAFSVWSRQRREDAEADGAGGPGYRVPGGRFLVLGRRYLEVLSLDRDPATEAALDAYVDCRRRASPAAAADLGEAAWLPEDGRVDGSLAFRIRGVFGFDRLTDAFTARYRVAGGEAYAFLSLRATPDDAATLAAAWIGFLAANGGGTPVDGTGGVRLLQVMGTWDAAAARGRVLAGVHEAPTREAAEALLGALLARLPAEGR